MFKLLNGTPEGHLFKRSELFCFHFFHVHWTKVEKTDEQSELGKVIVNTKKYEKIRKKKQLKSKERRKQKKKKLPRLGKRQCEMIMKKLEKNKNKTTRKNDCGRICVERKKKKKIEKS